MAQSSTSTVCRAVVIATALFFAGAVRAQQAANVPLSRLTGTADAAEAVDGPFGKLLIGHMVKAVIANTTAECRAQRKLDEAAIYARLREHVIYWGQRLSAKHSAAFDAPEFSETLRGFTDDAGFRGWRELLEDPRIAAAIGPFLANGDNLLTHIADHIDSALIAGNFRPKLRFNPDREGSAELTAQMEKAQEEGMSGAHAKLDALPRELVDRFMALSIALIQAQQQVLLDAAKIRSSMLPAPDLPGFAERFQALCFERR